MWKKLKSFWFSLFPRKEKIEPVPQYEYRPIEWEELTLDLEYSNSDPAQKKSPSRPEGEKGE